MSKGESIYKNITRRRTVVALLGLLLVVLLVAAACGEDATPTPRPATAVPAPTAIPGIPSGAPPTAVPAAPAPTAAPEPVIRAMSAWTVDNPATLEEIEAALEAHRGETLVFASWGGAYEGAQRQAYLIPFEDQFGVEVIVDTMNYAKVRAQVETGNIQFHVLDYGGQAAWQAALTDVLEELDFSIIDNRDFLGAGVSPWFGGGGITWSNVIAYSTEAVDEKWGGRTPTTMADMFDVETFPGRRALAAPEWSWKTSTRFALLSRYPELLETSEGRASLTILDDAQLDEAYEILTEIAPHINVWWSSGADCPSLLISRELDICTAWNGRIYDARIAGEAVAICWTCGHLINTDSWAVPNGLKAQDPNLFELAQLFMAWTSFPERNSAVSEFISYGPINMAGIPFLSGPQFDQVRDALPTSAGNVSYAIIEDENHDGQIGDAMGERWTEWQQAQ